MSEVHTVFLGAGWTTAIVGVWERDDSWPTPDSTHTILESSRNDDHAGCC